MKSILLLLVRLGMLSGLLISAPAHAFVVWAVHAGADSGSNTPGQALVLDTGEVQQVDLYFNTQGDISWGWDVTLGFIGDVTLQVPGGDATDPLFGLTQNGDLAGNPGAFTNGGYRQLGGNPFVNLAGTHLLFTMFVELGSPGSGILLNDVSSYTSGSLLDTISVDPGLLVTSAPVPLPGGIWLFASSLVVFRCGVKKIKSFSSPRVKLDMR